MKLLGKSIIVVMVMMMVAAVTYAEQSTEPATEIVDSVADWGKQQTADYIKSIFKPKEDKQAELDRLTFGTMIIQVCYVAAYGWLVSYMMPGKIEGLMRVTAFMWCVQYMAEYITSVIK